MLLCDIASLSRLSISFVTGLPVTDLNRNSLLQGATLGKPLLRLDYITNLRRRMGIGVVNSILI